jgi:3-deoxy-manno-octulosonate cytidylyltransferase (CMP-KDO synthetase)
MKVLAVIPARLASTRLPRKMLREVAGEPLIIRVYNAVRTCTLLDELLVATDSDEIAQICRERGCNVRMTSRSHQSGTERVHEISNLVSADVYINVQGDEPLTRPEHLLALIELMSDPKIEVGTLKTAAKTADIKNPNVVKVVTSMAGKALYFSRSAIPHDRDNTGAAYFKHLGFYAYRKSALDRFVALPASSLELVEKLEQLRFLEDGISIHLQQTPFDTIGIDTEDDLNRVEEIIKQEELKKIRT